MADYDHIIVGSGINALVCAAMLGKRGRKVLVLERSDRIGGCIRSEEITEPGFVHDVMAATFVLFVTSPAYAALGDDLARHGLAFSQTDTPTGALMPDGRSAILRTDRAANIAAFDALHAGDGARHGSDVGAVEGNAELLFGLLGGGLWSRQTAKLVARHAWKKGLRGFATELGQMLGHARSWLETGYGSDELRALHAPWGLHAGLGPESAFSGQMGRVIAFALEAAGAPIVTGGAARITQAFQRLIEEQGGAVRTGADVEAVVMENGRARGVRLAGGETIAATKGVICSVTPNQLYGRLLKGTPIPDEVSEATRTYRYGKGNMQIHYALSRPVDWPDARLADVQLLHLTGGVDAVSKASNEAERGMLPAIPTVCVGQPLAADPSRAPEGRGLLWIQLPEAPRTIKGDAAGTIAVPEDGRWTKDLREAFADRVEAMIEAHVPGFGETVLKRVSQSPADLEALNVNLVGGDPYGGYCGIDQFFLWRPFAHSVNHATHVPGLFHIGASTHPGPGLAGGSGFLAANALA